MKNNRMTAKHMANILSSGSASVQENIRKTLENNQIFQTLQENDRLITSCIYNRTVQFSVEKKIKKSIVWDYKGTPQTV